MYFIRLFTQSELIWCTANFSGVIWKGKMWDFLSYSICNTMWCFSTARIINT